MRAGEKVICIKTNHTEYGVGAIRGKCYTVEAVIKCRCGNIGLDVGIAYPYEIQISVCNMCGNRVKYPMWVHDHRRFRKLDYTDCTEELASLATIKRKEQDVKPNKTIKHESHV